MPRITTSGPAPRADFGVQTTDRVEPHELAMRQIARSTGQVLYLKDLPGSLV